MAKETNELIYITFALNNSVIGFKSTLCPDVVNKPHKDPICLPHYHFDKWYTDTTYVTEFDFTEQINDDTTIYGRSVINSNTVTYSAGEGTGTITDSNSPYDYYSDVTVLGTDDLTPPDGKVFDYWLLKYTGEKIPFEYNEYEQFEQKIAPGEKFRMPDFPVTLTAMYKDAPEPEEE